MPYPREYLRFRHDPITIDQITERTGGRAISTATTGEQLYGGDRETKKSSQPFVEWLLVLLACLFVMDVGLRRVQIDFDIIRSWFATRREDAKEEETFTALLKRRRSVKDEIAETHGGAPTEEPTWMAEQPGEKPAAKPMSLKEKAKERARMAAEAEKQAQEDDTTTGRLLAAKRKASKKNPKD